MKLSVVVPLVLLNTHTPLSKITDFQSLYEEEKKQKEELKMELLKLQIQIQKFNKMIFGPKSERFISNPGQLTLDIQAETIASHLTVVPAKKAVPEKTVRRKRDVSDLGDFINHLPHEYITKEPDNIPEGAEKIGVEEFKSLERKPGKLYVQVTLLPKYKITSEKNVIQIISAPAPERPLFKCIAGPSILAQILVDKFCDHLPVFRQAKRIERDGVILPYNTMLDWSGKTIDLFLPLYKVLMKEVIESNYIHADETHLKVLVGSENKKGKKIHSGYLWCYNNSIKNLMFFDYQPGRGESCTEGILKDFKGVLQTDGWQVYENVARKLKEIIHICCMAHARRKFKEAEQNDKDLASYALGQFQLLYDIERMCKEEGLSYDEITKVRQEKSVPILKEFKQWLMGQYKKRLPSEPISQAINYSLERWDRLSYYTTDGKLKPDNNPVERSIRPIALGRKNFLFAGSTKGAERLAIIYSLIGTCNMNGVNPYDWLKDVIGKINTYKLSQIHELLPHNWKLLNGKCQLTESAA